MRTIERFEELVGGFKVIVRDSNMYTKGRSGVLEVVLSMAELGDGTPETVAAAVKARLEMRALLANARGRDIDRAGPPTGGPR